MAHPQRSQAGFTLLELMVVAVIIGLLAGMAVLSIGVVGSDQELKREALRIKSVLELLQEEALMQGRDYGVNIHSRGYEFYIFDYDQYNWVDSGDTDILRPHELDAKLNLELNLDGRDIVLEPLQDGIEDPEPQVLVLSAGEMTAFELRFYRELTGGRFVVVGEITGKLTIEERGFE